MERDMVGEEAVDVESEFVMDKRDVEENVVTVPCFNDLSTDDSNVVVYVIRGEW